MYSARAVVDKLNHAAALDCPAIFRGHKFCPTRHVTSEVHFDWLTLCEKRCSDH